MSEPFVDYYDLLGVEATASDGVIKKAYRKKALKLHPDKNGHDPRAAELFDEVRRASEVLLDPAARAEFDGRRRQRKEHEIRREAMSAKRKEMQDALSRREKEAERQAYDAARFRRAHGGTPSKAREAEWRRLREEMASHQAAHAEELQRRQSAAARKAQEEQHARQSVLVRWTGGLASTMDEHELRVALRTYGTVASADNWTPRSATVRFDSRASVDALARAPPPGFRAAPLEPTEPSTGPSVSAAPSNRRQSADADRISRMAQSLARSAAMDRVAQEQDARLRRKKRSAEVAFGSDPASEETNHGGIEEGAERKDVAEEPASFAEHEASVLSMLLQKHKRQKTGN